MKAGGFTAPAALGIALHGLIPYRGVGRRADAFCVEGPASDAGFCRMAHCAANAAVPHRVRRGRDRLRACGMARLPARCGLRIRPSAPGHAESDRVFRARASNRLPCMPGAAYRSAVSAGRRVKIPTLPQVKFSRRET